MKGKEIDFGRYRGSGVPILGINKDAGPRNDGALKNFKRMGVPIFGSVSGRVELMSFPEKQDEINLKECIRLAPVFKYTALGFTALETGLNLHIAESTVKEHLRLGKREIGRGTVMGAIAKLIEQRLIDVSALMSKDNFARFNSMAPYLQDTVLYAGSKENWGKSNAQMAAGLMIGIDGLKRRLKIINRDMEFCSITEVRVFGHLVIINGIPVPPVSLKKRRALLSTVSPAILKLAGVFIAPPL